VNFWAAEKELKVILSSSEMELKVRDTKGESVVV